MLHLFTNYEREAGELARELGIISGSKVAEIGGGEGEMALVTAEIVGQSGEVYVTELDPEKISVLKKIISKVNPGNIKVVPGSQRTLNIPENHFDAIYIRAAYHHFTCPDELASALLRALRKDGKIAIVDFEPGVWSRPFRPAGVPENRRGHGMPKKILIKEMEDAGFSLVKTIKPWHGRFYCCVFRRPFHLV